MLFALSLLSFVLVVAVELLLFSVAVGEAIDDACLYAVVVVFVVEHDGGIYVVDVDNIDGCARAHIYVAVFIECVWRCYVA